MFVGKKIEVQLFGGTISSRRACQGFKGKTDVGTTCPSGLECETFPRVFPFYGDSSVSRIVS